MNKRVRVAFLVLVAMCRGLLAAPAEAATITGSSLSEVIFGANERDRIRAGGGNDIAFGKKKADKIFGEAGDDWLFGGGGPDEIDGGPGADTVIDDDSQGGDVLRGRDGDDLLISLDGGSDRVNCGPGFDIAVADKADDLIACERVASDGDAFRGWVVAIGPNDDNIFDLDDRQRPNAVFGRGGVDLIRAGQDDDLIFGGGAADQVFAEDDDDMLIDDDSKANDQAFPGDGDDTVFAADGARNAIDCSTDGDSGNGDVVYVDRVDQVQDCGTIHVRTGPIT